MTQPTKRSPQLAQEALLLIEQALPPHTRARLDTAGLSIEEVLNALSIHLDKKAKVSGGDDKLSECLQPYLDISNNTKKSGFDRAQAQLKVEVLSGIANEGIVPLDKLEQLEHPRMLRDSERNFAEMANAAFVHGTKEQRRAMMEGIVKEREIRFQDRPDAQAAFNAIAFKGIGKDLAPARPTKLKVFGEYLKAAKGVLTDEQVQQAASINLDFASKAKGVKEMAHRVFSEALHQLKTPVAKKVFRDICLSNKERFESKVSEMPAVGSFLRGLLAKRSAQSPKQPFIIKNG